MIKINPKDYAIQTIKDIAKEGKDLKNVRAILDYEIDNIPTGTYSLLLKYTNSNLPFVYLHSPDSLINTYVIDIETLDNYLLNGFIKLANISEIVLKEELQNFSFATYTHGTNISIKDLIFKDISNNSVFTIKSIAPNGIIYLRYADNSIVKSTIRNLEQLIRNGQVEFTNKNK